MAGFEGSNAFIGRHAFAICSGPCAPVASFRTSRVANTVAALLARARPLTDYPNSERRPGRLTTSPSVRDKARNDAGSICTARRGGDAQTRAGDRRLAVYSLTGYPGCLVAIYSIPETTYCNAGRIHGGSVFGGNVAPYADRIACMITVRKALWHLPTDLQFRLLRRIVGEAQREKLGAPLKRVVSCQGGAGLELEFWFQGCSEEEATHYASATLRDAAASITEVS